MQIKLLGIGGVSKDSRNFISYLGLVLLVKQKRPLEKRSNGSLFIKP